MKNHVEVALRSVISAIQSSANADPAPPAALGRILALLWSAYDEFEGLGPAAQQDVAWTAPSIRKLY